MKYIKDFEKLYSVTKKGEVYSHRLKRFLNGYKTNYHYVDLYKENKRYKKSIHRLVAETYLENPENKPEVHHKDGNTFNNNIENLEWVTRKENLSEDKTSRIRNFRECELHNKDGFIKSFKSIEECCRYCNDVLGLSKTSMSKYKKYRDYIIKV